MDKNKNEHAEHDEQTVFLLTDEQGIEHEMIVVYTFEAKETTYAVLIDRNDPSEDGVIFKVEEEGDELLFIGIEDDEEWERVVSIYEKIIQSEQE